MKSLQYTFKNIKRQTVRPKLQLTGNLVEQILLRTSPTTSGDLVRQFLGKLEATGKFGQVVSSPAPSTGAPLKNVRNVSKK